MRPLIGCSGALALVAFLIGFAVSLFVHDTSWMDRLMMALLTAAITFAAALLLWSRDWAKHSATRRSVRNELLAAGDTSDADFVSPRPFDEIELLLETRRAIARFFDVPAVKISRDIQLVHNLHVDKLEPSFQFYVVHSVIASKQIEPKPFMFSMTNLNTVDDLASAIRKVLDGFNRGS